MTVSIFLAFMYKNNFINGFTCKLWIFKSPFLFYTITCILDMFRFILF